MKAVRVEFFTHPICAGCWDVGRMLDRIVEDLPGLIELRRWSLADRQGRARSQECGVLEVPTVLIEEQDRVVGVPGDAEELRRRILAAAEDRGT
jgi:predicted DsbA family dithiol-disulfide isomerase